MERSARKEIKERRTLLLKAVADAGSLIASRFRRASHRIVRAKSAHEILTSTDMEAESLIVRSIRRRFPRDAILSEEAGGERREEGFLWIVDPLDGTTNFFIGNPVFTTSISLAYNGEPVMGATYHPLLKQTFFAERGKAFHLNGRRRTVSSTTSLSDAFIAFCHGTDDESIKMISDIFAKLKPRCRALRQLGAATFELALVAAGRVDAFIMPGVRAWDVAAGALMVREAAGEVVDFSGDDWDLNSRDLLASNPRLCREIISALR